MFYWEPLNKMVSSNTVFISYAVLTKLVRVSRCICDYLNVSLSNVLVQGRGV